MRLGVNIDHVASLRQLRKATFPDPVEASRIAQKFGADSIVVHLREDRRHICDRDLWSLKGSVRVPLNLEMSVAQEIVRIACKVLPSRATLVPERRQELTTEGGLDVAGNFKKVCQVIGTLHSHGIGVSLFIDPNQKQIQASVRAGVRMVELHTGRYANAKNSSAKGMALGQLKQAVGFARGRGLRVFAGHGLDYQNVRQIAKIKGIEELNIGYSIICRAVLVGLGPAIRQMKQLITL